MLEKDLEEWFTALNSPSNDLKPGPVKVHLEFQYTCCLFILYRPFLQYVIENIQSTEHADVNTFPQHILSRTQKAIDICTQLVFIARPRQLIDWFSLKKMVEAALLVVSASKAMHDDTLSKEEMQDTLNGATEIFARTSKRSESAKRALQLISEVRIGLKVGS